MIIDMQGIQLFQLRLSRRKGKRSNMSAKGLSGVSFFHFKYIIALFLTQSCINTSQTKSVSSIPTVFDHAITTRDLYLI